MAWPSCEALPSAVVVGIIIAVVLLAIGAAPIVAIGAGIGWTTLAFMSPQAIGAREEREEMAFAQARAASMVATIAAQRPPFARPGLYLLALAGRSGEDGVMASKPVDGVSQTWLWRGEVLLGPFPAAAYPHVSTLRDDPTHLWMYLTVGPVGHVEWTRFGMEPVRMLGFAPTQPIVDPAVLGHLTVPPTARLAS